MTPRVLIAGLGNIFLGDDAFGVEVARRLSRRKLPENVWVVDFGIRGLDLAFALLDGYDSVILVDASPRGGAPGALYAIEPDLSAVESGGDGGQTINGHGMEPLQVFRLARSMGGELPRLLVVGCEPELLEPAEQRMGLSGAVEAAIEPAIEMIQSLVAQITGSQGAVRE
jgi:hydrogenase maturation protease